MSGVTRHILYTELQKYLIENVDYSIDNAFMEWVVVVQDELSTVYYGRLIENVDYSRLLTMLSWNG